MNGRNCAEVSGGGEGWRWRMGDGREQERKKQFEPLSYDPRGALRNRSFGAKAVAAQPQRARRGHACACAPFRPAELCARLLTVKAEKYHGESERVA
eukprot:5925524-Pleurochrysis_carterae.AAC.2